MAILLVGILIFAGVHLVPSLAPGQRSSLVTKLGENFYKGLFSLSLLLGIGLIVVGWRSSIPSGIYAPPAGLQSMGLALMYLAFFLMVVSSRPSRLKQLIRHPQLTGVTCWSIAHLMLNGDSRSLLLFGGIGIWAVVEMFAINRRDGQWQKPAAKVGLATDLVNLLIALAVVALLVFIHPWLSGVPVR